MKKTPQKAVYVPGSYKEMEYWGNVILILAGAWCAKILKRKNQEYHQKSLVSFLLSEENFESRYSYRIWLQSFSHSPCQTQYFLATLRWGLLWKWLCVGAVICTRLCARSRLSFSKATNWIIKGALYTPISRRRQREEGSLDCIQGKQRKNGWYTSYHSKRLMCARWGRHAL